MDQPQRRTRSTMSPSPTTSAACSGPAVGGQPRPSPTDASRILLKADESDGGLAWSDEAIRQALDIGLSTVARMPTLCRGGLGPPWSGTTPSRLQPPGRWRVRSPSGSLGLQCAADGPPTLDAAPAGRPAGCVSTSITSRTKPCARCSKTNLSLGKEGVVHSTPSQCRIRAPHGRCAGSVYAPSRRYPLVCFDETSKQLIGETRRPLPAEARSTRALRLEYAQRGGEPVHVLRPCTTGATLSRTEHRTKQDWAYCMRPRRCPLPRRRPIRLVEDNLNTHDPAALYEVFEPARKSSASWIGWSSITRPSMAAGSTWLRSNSAS